MNEEPDYDFSATHYASLSELEQAVLQEVAIHLTGEKIDPGDEEGIAMTFNILRPCEGCIPVEEIGGNLLADIRRKFACLYDTAVERAEEALKAAGLLFAFSPPC